MYTRYSIFTVLLVSVLFLGGCAQHGTPEAYSDPYGFFSGIWHGLVFPFALVASIFSWLVGLFGFSILDSIELIGRPNTGLFYYVGFALGLFSYGSGA